MQTQSFVGSALGLSIIQGLGLLVPVLLIPLIVNVDSVEAFGRFAIVVGYYNFAAMICDYGFDYSAVRALKQYPRAGKIRDELIRDTVSAKLLIFVLASPIAAIGLYVVAGISDIYLIVCGLLIPATSVFSVQWIFLADGKLLKLSVPIAIARVVSVAATYLVYPIWPIIAVALLVPAVPVALIHLFFWREQRKEARSMPWFSLAGARRALSNGRTTFSIASMGSYISMSSVIAVSALVTTKEAGIYVAVERVAKAGFGIAKPLLVALYPEMASLFQSSRSQWRKLINRILGVALLLGVVSWVGILLLWGTIARFLFGEEAPGSEWIAYGFATWLTVGVMNNAVGIQGLIASGNERMYQRSLVVAVSLLTIGYMLFGRAWGALGVVGAMLLAEVTLLFLNSYALRNLNKHAASI